MWFAKFQEAPSSDATARCKKQDGTAAGQTGRASPRRVVGALLLVLLPVMAIGCDEATEPEATTVAPDVPRGPEMPRIKWLDQNSKTPPEQWLASRQAKTDLAGNDPSVVAIGASLSAAAHHFRDPPRMIANRAVQLEEMLANAGIAESAPELIDALTSATGSTTKEGFGSICQHYFNLRKQGVGREVALEQLKGTSLLSDGDRIRRADESQTSNSKRPLTQGG